MQKSKPECTKKIRESILITKIFVIFYIVCLGLIYLTSHTEAQFTGTRVDNQVIQAGEWWDGSSLIFNSTDDQIIESCEPVELAVEIKNDSMFAMYGTTEYEVYNTSLIGESSLEIGNSVSDGDLEIAIIEPGETSTLTHTVSTPGDYVFIAYQRPKYNNNEAERASIMSELLTVTCFEEGKDRGNESGLPTEVEIEKDEESEESEESDRGLELDKDEEPGKSDDVPGQDKHEVSKEPDSLLEQVTVEEPAEGDETDE